MADVRIVLKRCAKCGKTSTVAPRERRCKRIVEVVRGLNPPRRYYCWGLLDRVVKKQKWKLEPRPGLGIGSLLGEEGVEQAIAARCDRVRDEAQRNLQKARQQINIANDSLRQLAAKSAKLATNVRQLETRAGFYARRASMTNEEIEAERQRAKNAAAKRGQKGRTRQIEVEE